jgi:hypothetical protein
MGGVGSQIGLATSSVKPTITPVREAGGAAGPLRGAGRGGIGRRRGTAGQVVRSALGTPCPVPEWPRSRAAMSTATFGDARLVGRAVIDGRAPTVGFAYGVLTGIVRETDGSGVPAGVVRPAGVGGTGVAIAAVTIDLAAPLDRRPPAASAIAGRGAARRVRAGSAARPAMQGIAVVNAAPAAVVEARVAGETTGAVGAGGGRVGRRDTTVSAPPTVALVGPEVNARITAGGKSRSAVGHAIGVFAQPARPADATTFTAIGGVTLCVRWRANHTIATSAGALTGGPIADAITASAVLAGFARLLTRPAVLHIRLEVDAVVAACGQPAAAAEHTGPDLADVACTAPPTTAAAPVVPAGLAPAARGAATSAPADPAGAGSAVGQRALALPLFPLLARRAALLALLLDAHAWARLPPLSAGTMPTPPPAGGRVARKQQGQQSAEQRRQRGAARGGQAEGRRQAIKLAFVHERAPVFARSTKHSSIHDRDGTVTRIQYGDRYGFRGLEVDDPGRSAERAPGGSPQAPRPP